MPCIIVSQLLIPITIIDYYHNYGCLMFMYQTKITASVWAKVKQILQTDSFLHSFHLSDIHSTNAFQSLIYWRNSWRCWGNIVLGGVLLSHRALLAVRKRDSKGSESGQGQLSGGDRRAGSSGWEGARSGKSCRQREQRVQQPDVEKRVLDPKRTSVAWMQQAAGRGEMMGLERKGGVLRTILSNLRFATKCNKKPLNCQTAKWYN